MHVKQFIPIHLVVVLLLFCSCETEESDLVEQQQIFVAYDLFYNENEDTTRATVIFTFGNRTGTRLVLSEGATIRYDNTPMTYDNVLGLYSLEIAGYDAMGTFVYEDLEANTFTNAVSLNPISFDNTVPETIDRSESYEIGWVGNTVATDLEVVVVTVVPNNLGQTTIFSQNNREATTVLLTSDRLLEIDPQPAELVIERIAEQPVLESSAAGAVITSRYRANVISIAIE
ncbi:MAG: hypothetical protein AAF717_04175 [Bacteroidota bacterium]